LSHLKPLDIHADCRYADSYNDCYDAVSSIADINGAIVGIETHKKPWRPRLRGLVLYPFRKGNYILFCVKLSILI
jgi:hypothetical protein